MQSSWLLLINKANYLNRIYSNVPMDVNHNKALSLSLTITVQVKDLLFFHYRKRPLAQAVVIGIVAKAASKCVIA